MEIPEPPKDKRTKAYKQWKAKYDADGLGTKVEKITKATGIDKAVKWIAGEDCGCDKRKDALNRKFRAFKCLKEWEYNYLSEFIERNPPRVTAQEQEKLLQISNRIFNRNRKPSRCGSCLVGIINELKKVYGFYSESNTDQK